MKIELPSDLTSIEDWAISADGQVVVWRDLEFFVLDPNSLIWQSSPRLEDTIGDNEAAPEEAETSRVRFVGWVGDRVMAMLRDRCGVWKPGENQWSWLRPGYRHGNEAFQRKFEREYHVWSRVTRVRSIQNWVFFEKFTGSPPWTGTRVIEAYQLVGNRLVDRGRVPVDSQGEEPFDVWLVEGVPVVLLGRMLVRPGSEPAALHSDGVDTHRSDSEAPSDIGGAVAVGGRIVIPSRAGRSRLIDVENASVEMVPLADPRIGGAIWESWIKGDRDRGRHWLWSGLRALSMGIGPLLGASRIPGAGDEAGDVLFVGQNGFATLTEEPAPLSIDWPESIQDVSLHMTRLAPWLLWAWGLEEEGEWFWHALQNESGESLLLYKDVDDPLTRDRLHDFDRELPIGPSVSLNSPVRLLFSSSMKADRVSAEEDRLVDGDEIVAACVSGNCTVVADKEGVIHGNGWDTIGAPWWPAGPQTCQHAPTINEINVDHETNRILISASWPHSTVVAALDARDGSLKGSLLVLNSWRESFDVPDWIVDLALNRDSRDSESDAVLVYIQGVGSVIVFRNAQWFSFDSNLNISKCGVFKPRPGNEGYQFYAPGSTDGIYEPFKVALSDGILAIIHTWTGLYYPLEEEIETDSALLVDVRRLFR